MGKMLIIRLDARLVVLIGLLLVLVGVFLPWVNLPAFLGGDLTRWGLTGGGFFTLTLSVLGLFSLLLPWRLLRRTALPAAVVALLSDFVALLALIGVMRNLYTLSLNLGAYPGAIGSGLYMTFAGALLAFVAGLWPVPNDALDSAPADGSATAWQGGPARLELLILAVLVGIFPLTCACAILAGVLIGPVSSVLQLGAAPITAPPTAGPSSSELLATPLIDVQVTLWNVTPSPATPTQTLATPSGISPHLAVPTTAVPIAPLATPTGAPPTLAPFIPTRGPALTSTPIPSLPTATLPISPLTTPTPGP